MSDSELITWSKEELSAMRDRVIKLISLTRELNELREEMFSVRSPMLEQRVQTSKNISVLEDDVVKYIDLQDLAIDLLYINLTEDFMVSKRFDKLNVNQDAQTVMTYYFYLGWSIEKIALRMGVTRMTVSRWKNKALIEYGREFCPSQE